MSKTSPTNTDIMKLLGVIQGENNSRHAENDKRLSAIEEQVKYTNGQVRSLNQWRSNQEAVEAYKKANPESKPLVKVNNNFQWDWRTIVTAVAVVIVALYTLFVQGGPH